MGYRTSGFLNLSYPLDPITYPLVSQGLGVTLVLVVKPS
jgi:hypothetical protein